MIRVRLRICLRLLPVILAGGLGEKIATGRGIKVAVIDTGVAVNNSVHTPVDRFSAWDVLPLKQGAAPNDPLNCQHGTVVASLIGAERDRRGITNFSGIAPDATVIGIRALYDNSQQEIDGVVAAIKVAITLRVDIINISQAAVGNRGEYADAIAEAVNSGIVVVAAAGNGNDQNMPPGTLAYPAVYPEVIAVDMTDQHRRSEERRVGKECRSRWSPYH